MTYTPEQDRQEHIDRFLLGQMTPEEENGFKRQLTSDRQLADEVGIMRRIMKAISLRASRRECMERWDNEDKAAATTSTSSGRRRWMPWISAAAIVAVILTAGSIFFIQEKTEFRSAATRLSAQATPGNYRGESVETRQIEHQINSLRKEARFTLSDIDSNLEHSMVEKGLRPQEAAYQQIMIDRERYELTWLRIKALISAGQIREAKSELQKYAAEEGYNQEAAKSLLKQFE